MKKYIVPFLVGCFIAFIIYLGFSFANVSFDIRKWHEVSRFMCAPFMVFAVFIPYLFYDNINEKKVSNDKRRTE